MGHQVRETADSMVAEIMGDRLEYTLGWQAGPSTRQRLHCFTRPRRNLSGRTEIAVNSRRSVGSPSSLKHGTMFYRTSVPKSKVALTLDTKLLQRVDELVERRRFRSRSQAVESALADKLQRLARTRLARESAKLNPREEKRLADEGLAEDFASWPEY